MSREITSHKVNGCNNALTIEAGEPGAGGAPTDYSISGYSREPGSTCELLLCFQRGNPNDPAVGVNGITQEALLAIVEDRLKCFQAGPYSSRENSIALTKLQEAMMWLKRRTEERAARGVEGALVK